MAKYETKFAVGDNVKVLKTDYRAGECEYCGHFSETAVMEKSESVGKIESIEIELDRIFYSLRFASDACRYKWAEDDVIGLA